jgi:hypothetical protein
MSDPCSPELRVKGMTHERKILAPDWPTWRPTFGYCSVGSTERMMKTMAGTIVAGPGCAR